MGRDTSLAEIGSCPVRLVLTNWNVED